MYFLYMKIMDTTYKDDIFIALESVGIDKASYFESNNLEKSLTDEMPLFKGFFTTDDENNKKVLMVTALVESKEQVKEFRENLEATGIDLKKEFILRYAILPVEEYF